MKKENLKSAITCDLDGKVLSFSRGAENIFGYKSKDVVGKMRVSDFTVKLANAFNAANHPGRFSEGHELRQSVGA